MAQLRWADTTHDPTVKVRRLFGVAVSRAALIRPQYVIPSSRFSNQTPCMPAYLSAKADSHYDCLAMCFAIVKEWGQIKQSPSQSTHRHCIRVPKFSAREPRYGEAQPEQAEAKHRSRQTTPIFIQCKYCTPNRSSWLAGPRKIACSNLNDLLPAKCNRYTDWT